MAQFHDPCALSEDLAELAYKNYGETKEKRVSLLREMRERIQALPEKDRLKDLSDKNLIRFLRCRKFDIERAVKLACDAKRFYTKNADILKDLDGKETVMFDGEHNNVFQVYRNVDKDGKVVIILHPSRFIQAVQSKQGSTIIKKDPSAVLRHLVWQFHNLCQDPHVQVGGLIS